MFGLLDLTNSFFDWENYFPLISKGEKEQQSEGNYLKLLKTEFQRLRWDMYLFFTSLLIKFLGMVNVKCKQTNKLATSSDSKMSENKNNVKCKLFEDVDLFGSCAKQCYTFHQLQLYFLRNVVKYNLIRLVTDTKRLD